MHTSRIKIKDSSIRIFSLIAVIEYSCLVHLYKEVALIQLRQVDTKCNLDLRRSYLLKFKNHVIKHNVVTILLINNQDFPIGNILYQYLRLVSLVQ